MHVNTSDIAALLLRCEQDGLAPRYDDAPDSQVAIASQGAELFVVSDLHLATGPGADGRYDGCENFFYDAAFRRFLQCAHHSLAGKPAILIINGDFIDFLRVTYVPGREQRLSRWQRLLTQLQLRSRSQRLAAFGAREQQEFGAWQQILPRIGIHKTVDELIHAVSDKEELYGLKTDAYKSVLKLDRVLHGHPAFFEALAEWLGHGHRLIIVKGNHDLEWYWPAIRNYLRLDLAERLARQTGPATDVQTVLGERVLPRLTFIDHALLIDGTFYVEHGHRYDPLTTVIGEATLEGGQELNIPFGSFFNRYLLNFVELNYPFLNNVRPTKNMLPLLLRHRFFAGLRFLVDHLVVLAKTIPKRYVRRIFGQHIIARVLLILGVSLVPPVLLIVQQVRTPGFGPGRLLEWAGWLALSYVLIQILAYAQLKEPDSLAQYARAQFRQRPDYILITFGHTHNPDQFHEHDRWFYNTGTWIPIVETTTADLRCDKTFTFVRLSHDAAGNLSPHVLQRWDDASGRMEDMVLIRRAGA